ncbi:hypothetical protein GCM10009654_06000 [Streptomyces hebeiensis]|uniref:Uncharacterized protein n=1 Tax=Streptomyces hebeiensis TaxID=229486 RepID=A0ABN1UJ43_9ACTN
MLPTPRRLRVALERRIGTTTIKFGPQSGCTVGGTVRSASGCCRVGPERLGEFVVLPLSLEDERALAASDVGSLSQHVTMLGVGSRRCRTLAKATAKFFQFMPVSA